MLEDGDIVFDKCTLKKKNAFENVQYEASRIVQLK
jgi:hypothetical protein